MFSFSIFFLGAAIRRRNGYTQMKNDENTSLLNWATGNKTNNYHSIINQGTDGNGNKESQEVQVSIDENTSLLNGANGDKTNNYYTKINQSMDGNGNKESQEVQVLIEDVQRQKSFCHRSPPTK